MKWMLHDGGWNPYVAGAPAGVLAVVSAAATTRVLRFDKQVAAMRLQDMTISLGA